MLVYLRVGIIFIINMSIGIGVVVNCLPLKTFLKRKKETWIEEKMRKTEEDKMSRRNLSSTNIHFSLNKVVSFTFSSCYYSPTTVASSFCSVFCSSSYCFFLSYDFILAFHFYFVVCFRSRGINLQENCVWQKFTSFLPFTVFRSSCLRPLTL